MASNYNVIQMTMTASTGKGLNSIFDELGVDGMIQMVKYQNKYIYKIRIPDDNDDELNLQAYMKVFYKSSFRNKMRNIQIFNSSEIYGTWNNREILRRNNGY